METKWFRWLLVVGLVVGACTPGATEASYKPYSITLEDAYCNHLRTFHHKGEVFALGHYGDRYNIRVTNHTSRRVEAVVSVDGRDVISGQKGDYENQRGYLVDAYDSVLIEGFRTSMHGVAAFRFTNPADSYSSRMGTPENVGVVGAAFFPERHHRPVARPRPKQLPRSERSTSKGRGERRRNAPAAPPAELRDSYGAGSSASGSAEGSVGQAEASRRSYDYDAAEAAPDDDTSNIGTEYGEHRHSDVREVTFVRESARRPHHVLTLRYDDAQGLLARGIEIYPRQRHYPEPHQPHGPEAFPMSRFAPPPPPSYR